MKFSLLIQGPILSIGKTNKDLKTGETNDKVINFDSSTYILENVKNFSHLFKKIVISTWTTENVNQIKNELSKIDKVKLIQLDDSYKAIYQKKFKHKNLASNFNNKLKMFNGINKVIKYFDDDEIIIRIRTDQRIDLNLITNEIINKNKFNKFYVPYVRGDGYFQDFYFAANKKLMRNLFSYYCDDYIEITYSSHFEFFYRVFIGMSFKNKYLIATSSLSQLIVGKILEKKFFEPLPEQAYKSILWRGNSINISNNNLIFFSNLNKKYYKTLNNNLYFKRYLLLISILTPTKQTFDFGKKINPFIIIISKILFLTGLSKVIYYILRKLI